MAQKKVFVSGCFDMLHSGHIRFLEKAARYGDVYLALGSDRTVLELKGRAPVTTEQERKYMLEAVRHVKHCAISRGSGIMDFMDELKRVKPDIFIVNEDGNTPAKAELCRRINAELSSRILARRGARLPMLASGLGMAAGGVLLSRLTDASPTWPIVLAFCVFGIGAGLVNPPITYAAVSGMPTTQAGVASSIASTSRQVGQSLGVAVTGSILAASLHGPLRARFVPASHAAWLLLAACGAAVFLLGLVTTSRWALGTAVRTAARYEDTAEPKTAVTTR